MKEIEYIQVGDYQLPNLKVEEMHSLIEKLLLLPDSQ